MRTREAEALACAVRGIALLGVAALVATPARASAQQSLSGTWQAGATSMQVSVESWGKDCGPQPKSSQSAGGGGVTLEQQGQALVIHARDHEVRSDRCWSPNPTLRRVASSYANGLWTTRCQTPSGDPREEQGNYTLKLLGTDRLLYQDVSHFNWRLNDSTCTATITTTQTLHRGAAAAAAATKPAAGKPVTTTTTPAQATTPPAPDASETEPASTCTPKTAARLSLRPRHAEIALGDRTCFRARVVDAKGCPLPDAAVTWSLKNARGLRATLDGGCFSAGISSAESEGEFRVVAARGRLRAEATVVVAAESLTAILAKRLQAGAIEGTPGAAQEQRASADASVAPAPPAVRVAARAVKEAEPPGTERWLAAVAAALAAAAAILLLSRRSSARRRTSANTAARKRRCPDCGSTYPESSAFCGKDGSALLPPQ
jgi:hypothetical protein